MPTSTFLPYFVRFLKENTAVRFFPPIFFFFILESESSHIIYVMKTWSEFLNDNDNDNDKDCTREHLKPVCFQGP